MARIIVVGTGNFEAALYLKQVGVLITLVSLNVFTNGMNEQIKVLDQRDNCVNIATHLPSKESVMISFVASHYTHNVITYYTYK